MKKENRKLAQERKAQERKKQKQTQLIKKAAMIAVPVLIIVVVIWLLSRPDNQTTNDENTTTNTTIDTAEPLVIPELNTDTELAVEDGDTVNIDYVGTVDGVEFSGGSTGGMGTDLTIGSGMYIDDFEEQLIGYNVGDTVEVVVTFPDNYGVEDLNGKEAVFTTIINGIYK